MQIDPAILLAEELRLTEEALTKATQGYSNSNRRENGKLVSLLLRRTKRLLSESAKILPTSALGAAELLNIATRRLPFSCAQYASHLYEISERLAEGVRTQNDLIWLRAFSEGLDEGFLGKDGNVIASWIRLAILGASRPILVYRSARAERGRAPWKNAIEEFDAEVPGHINNSGISDTPQA